MIRQDTAEALAQWDRGEAVRAIAVESAGSPQEAIYACAFEILRVWSNDGALYKEEFRAAQAPALSDREFDAAVSVAHVAATKGWTAMIEQHRHPSIAEITVRKPEAVKGVAGTET